MRSVIEQTIRDFEASETAKMMDDNFQSAYRLMTSPEARQAFDLSLEPIEVRERYGMNRFGQCCLLARRMIEAGVRFVTINTFLTVFDEITWDIHGTKPFTSVEGMKTVVAPMYDQGYSALIEDLDRRQLLQDTLVCNLAEFGRTPKVNPAGGRDHWPQCFSVYFAGGGVQGGRAIGASDPIGAVPAIARQNLQRSSPPSFIASAWISPATSPPGWPSVPVGRRRLSRNPRTLFLISARITLHVDSDLPTVLWCSLLVRHHFHPVRCELSPSSRRTNISRDLSATNRTLEYR